MDQVRASPWRNLGFACTTIGCPKDCELKRLRMACRWFRKWLQATVPTTRAPCVVFDIDDTLIHSKQGTGIAPTIELAAECAKNGVTVFMVTARGKSREAHKFTVEQLARMGIEPSMFARLYLMNRDVFDVTPKGVADFKYHCRQHIRRSHTVLGSVGDNFTDLLRYPVRSAYKPLLRGESGDFLLFVNKHELNDFACLKIPFLQRHT